MLGFILLTLLLALMLAVLPIWPYSLAWGYGPVTVVATLTAAFFFLIWWGLVALNWPWARPA